MLVNADTGLEHVAGKQVGEVGSACERVGFGVESVADRGIVLEELSLFVMEFLADAVGVDLQVVVLGDVSGTPDVLQDHASGADLAEVTG